MSKTKLTINKRGTRARIRSSLASLRQVFILLVFLTSLVGMNPLPARADSPSGFLEGFESGWTDHTFIDNAAWYSGNGVYVENDFGIGGTWGLSNSANIFTWMAHPFQWDDPTLTGVILGMDFQTNGSSQFDDDRVGWMIQGSSINSDHIFGVQLDPGGGGQNIEAYWDGNTFGDDGGRTSIVTLPSLSANAWYRLRAEITKLTDTSARIDVTLTELDGSGNPGSVLASGSIPDTSLLPNTAGEEIPNDGYFTATTLYPGYKNHNGTTGYADNAYFEILTGAPPIQHTLTVTDDGNGSVTLDPAGGTYDENTVVTLTPVSNSGYEFDAWGGANAGDLTDNGNGSRSITMNTDKELFASFSLIPVTMVCESFDAFTPGSTIGTYSGWYDGGSGPVVTAGNGLLNSVGLAAAANIYTWTAHPFNWNDLTFQSVTLQQDFETNASGLFDDDRLGWMMVANSVDSANSFGVQLDHPDGGIVTYWRNGSTRIQDPIVALPTLPANTWYRFTAEIIKLSPTSAQINVILVQLDASGNPTGTPYTGTVADTSAWGTGGSRSPDARYFTPTAMWPAYKSFNAAASAPADNPCYEVILGTPPPQYNLVVDLTGNGSVLLNPPGGTYYEGTVVQLTATADTGWEFTGWSGDMTATDNPLQVTMDGDKSITATFTELPPVTLTVDVVGNGSVTLDPAGGSYPFGTVVQLTAAPDADWHFSGWSGDLTGNTTPASITMNADKAVTATFTELPPPPAGTCEGFETGFALGQTVGAHADWFDAGSGPVVNAAIGLSGSNGLAPANDIFTWTAHPFDWNDPAFESITYSADFQTDGSGQFDDDRLGWMISNTSASSAYIFGVQLDHADGGIVTYWRKDIDDTSTASRVQTPIVDLATLPANTWYRFEATFTKLTDSSARIDVSLVQLDASGNPTGTPATGTLDDTSAWADGVPDLRYFTATSMWPAYKNYNAITGAADNVCFDIASGRFAFVVTTDWHTSDSNPNTSITNKLTQIANLVNNPTAEMPAPEFLVITGDLPAAPQTESVIDSVLGVDFLWFPVIGNHEIDDGISNFNYIRDTLVPALPATMMVDNGPAGSVNTTYSFDYQNAHFVIVNGYWDGTTNPGADSATLGDIPPALRTWVDADLASNGQTHNFAFIHEPAYPFNRHVGDSLDAYPANRDAFVATLNAHNVETLFTGHTHYYEHDVAPEYPLGNLDQITNGSLRDGDETTFTYVLVEGNVTTYKVYSWSGSAFNLIENWMIGGSLPSQPPAAPTSLSATAVSYASINLTWSDNSDNETGFEIERSTDGSGGPFSLLTTVLADTESYADAGLTSQSEYCYRVRAVNSAGGSAYTEVVCATTPEIPPFVGTCESFDTGFTLGQPVGNHVDWYDNGGGPVVTSGNGLVGSTGLAPAVNIFTWTAQPFNWNDPAFQSINFQMDFQTNGSGQFDDDRLGWMTTDSSVSSDYIFGVQLDHSDGGIVTYWRDSGGTRIQTPIVALPTLPANTWYRFKAEMTKLSNTSAMIYVSLVQLDASGNPTGSVYTGAVSDTSTWSGGAPATSYFTAATLWPAYKNYNAITGAADNACYESLSGLNTIITSQPSNPTNSTNASFSFTSTEAGSTFECQLDGSGFAACASPANYPSLSEGSHTFQVRAINGGDVDPTPATYTWSIVTSTIPGPTTLISPTGFIGTDYSPTYTWEYVDTAEATFIQVFDSAENLVYQGYYVSATYCDDTTCSHQPAVTLTGGTYTWYGRTWNSYGWGPWSAPLTFSTAPDTTITGSPDLLSASANAAFTFTSDDPDATFECSLDAGAFATCASPKNYTALADGSHTFQVRAVESLGNPDPTPASYTWAIDTTAPDTSITSQPSDPSGSANATFTFTSTEAGSTFECRLDGSAFAACTSPNPYTGLADGSHTFQVRATDTLGHTDPTPASYTWTVNAVNDPPTLALSNTVTSLAENTDTSAAIRVADVTITDDGLGTNNLSLSGADAALFEITGSSLYLKAGAALDHETNPVLDVTVAVNDPAVGANPDDSESLAISITDVNEAPVANNQSVTTDEDTAVAITLTGSDVDSDPLTFTVVDSPLHGTLTGAAPALTYTPDANYNGPDSFTFKASDGALDSNIATVSITVNAVNDAPVCAPVSLDTDEDTAGQADPSCTDIEGDPLSYSIAAQPAHGSASVALGKLVYTPNANYNGPDSFAYKANDGLADSNAATVTVTVNPVNDAPTANGQTLAVDEDTALPITLTGSDIEGDPLAFAVTTPPAHGTLSGSAPNLTYTPDANYNGPDSFTFTVNDGDLDSAPATVSITVNPVNDAPVANAQIVSTPQDTPLPITLTGSDVENDPLTFTIVTDPANGVLSGTAPDLTYTPDPGFSGVDSFSFTVNDGLLDSAPAVVQINVAYVNTAPTDIALSNASVEENKPVGTLVGTFTSTDPDAGDTFTYTFCGGADDASFTIDVDALKAAEVFDFETKASYDICVQTDDGNGGTFQKAFTIAVTDGKPVTLTFRSQAAYDGWVLESSETSNKGGTLNSTVTTFNLGDNRKNQQFRGILSFNTAALPNNAVITKVLIKIRRQGLVGTDPFTTHQGLKVDVRKWSFSKNKLLQITDFQAWANKNAIGTFNKTPANSWYTARLNTAAFPFVNLNGLTQFRLRFAKDDDNDNLADYMKFFSGNAALGNRPQLVITYYIP